MKPEEVGRHQHPGPENQDSQHMIDQPRGSFPEKSCPGDFVFFLSYQERVQNPAGFATPAACYRGPKPQNCPKCLGEGAKGVLVYVGQKPVALVQERVALVQTSVALVQETLGRSFLGCFQYGRFVATCGPCMNFTTFRTSRKLFQR